MTEPVPEYPPDRPTMAPFLGALVIIVLVVIGIVVFNRSDDDAAPDQDVSRAVVGQNDALQRQSYADFRDYTCRAKQGNEAEFVARQQDSVAKDGERYVDGVRDVRVDGDRAIVNVTYHFDKTPDRPVGSELTVVREDGTWKVCS